MKFEAYFEELYPFLVADCLRTSNAHDCPANGNQGKAILDH